jgi:hypothetical protein
MCEISSVYQVDLSFYKDLRLDVELSLPYELLSIAKEMIYYNHWANLVMFEYLNSNDDISFIIDSLDIRTINEFFETGSLF